jgi:phosphoglycerol transferase MdoB-like AlkP superfamily enzyme
MNKKLNTIFFILGATLLNVLVAIISFILLMLIYVKFLNNLIPEQSGSWVFALIFLISIAVSFIVYRYLLKYLLRKIDVDKYFDPLFVRRNIRKPGS